MAKKKEGNFITRIMMGKEKSEGYARASLPSNRWELFWDILKGRFGKLVIINLLMLLFFLPAIALIVIRVLMIKSMGTMYPFSQCFGAGYGAPPSMMGLSENIIFLNDRSVFLFAPVAFMIAAVGLSGGAYVLRNMVWTEGIFVANDFWRGIRQNIKQLLLVALLYSVVFYITIVSISLCNMQMAAHAPHKWMFIVSEIFSYIFILLYSIMTLHMVTMSVTYKLTLRQLIKNSFLFTIGLFPQNIFFIFLGILPFGLFLIGNGFFLALGLMVVIFIAFSLFMLVWTDYSQWIYDKFINDKVPGAEKNKGIYEKVKESDAGALKQYREQMAMVGRSSLASKPIKPITDEELKLAELPQSFNRSDLEKLRESKEAIYLDNEKYIEEHKDDPEFQPTEEELELEKEKQEREKRIEKAKKELAKRNKK